MKGYFLFAITATLLLGSCANNDTEFDASGSFEATETVISAEANGVLEKFTVEEGMKLKANQYIGYVDSTQLYLKKKQLEAQIQTALAQRPDVSAQLASLQIQLEAAIKDQKRIANMAKENAATEQQLDDANSRVDVLKKQIHAQRSSLNITTESINAQANPLQVQIDQMDDQLEKCRLINPVNGTVLTTYAEEKEVVNSGKPLYRIADISSLFLRAYVSGTQLSQIKLNQQVDVFIDKDEDDYRQYKGEITWISDKAEFTPKTIQTKEERANLVYAVKVKVKNDGYLKIGMYGGVNLPGTQKD
ncbi:HlyD family secretion protein [Fulvivirga ligni]|uniref:HlyD family secretion protein n=1 Tax=Fulvivirga ligni TaxID=2904246 RepID=UPI001F43DA41|nr:HlyD family efflux transporter periplasmic adaptor subunit [Fulvivirga ligni]UII21004.1 HlyD family efflux transporter periplasmic adaptor subunit [Fulvivirga ligni]